MLKFQFLSKQHNLYSFSEDGFNWSVVHFQASTSHHHLHHHILKQPQGSIPSEFHSWTHVWLILLSFSHDREPESCCMTWYYGRRINSWTHSHWFGYWQSSRFRCSHITSTDWSCAQWLWAYIIKQILLHHFIAHGFKSINCFDSKCLELRRGRARAFTSNRKSRESDQWKKQKQQDKTGLDSNEK